MMERVPDHDKIDLGGLKVLPEVDITTMDPPHVGQLRSHSPAHSQHVDFGLDRNDFAGNVGDKTHHLARACTKVNHERSIRQRPDLDEVQL